MTDPADSFLIACNPDPDSTLPAPLQDEARHRGLIPDLPATTAPASEAV